MELQWASKIWASIVEMAMGYYKPFLWTCLFVSFILSLLEPELLGPNTIDDCNFVVLVAKCHHTKATKYN